MIVPTDKRWLQPNNGTAQGNVHATWGVDFDANRGSVHVSKPLKKVFDTSDNAQLTTIVGKFVQYESTLYAISNYVFKVSTSPGVDITDTTLWSQDAKSNTPDPGATVTDAVVFDGLLLVQDGNTIKSYNGSSWADWWKTTLGQSSLVQGEPFVLKVGSDGNFYTTDGGNKVYRVTPTGTVTKTGEGTLDFSATEFVIINGTTTSSRIFYGTEDTAGENCAIIEWDMSPSSTAANRIHRMGTKRVLCIATDANDMVVAILSDGSVKYFNGDAFVDYPGAHLPKTKYQYGDDVIHKNGWMILDNMLHFSINPRVDIDEDSYTEVSSQFWNYPAGIYCLDPQVGLYCRYAFRDTTTNLPVSSIGGVGALFAKTHANTSFFTSFVRYLTSSTTRSYIACEDSANSAQTKSWLLLNPFEGYDQVINKLTLIHKRLGTGDSITVYYRRFDEEPVRVSGYWTDTTTFNTTDSVTGIGEDWFVLSKIGIGAGYTSTVRAIESGTTSVITMKDANTNVTLNDEGVLEFVNFKKMATITQTTIEWDELAIPDTTKSRHLWIFLEITQAAGNDVELDYIMTN